MQFAMDLHLGLHYPPLAPDHNSSFLCTSFSSVMSPASPVLIVISASHHGSTPPYLQFFLPPAQYPHHDEDIKRAPSTHFHDGCGNLIPLKSIIPAQMPNRFRSSKD